MFRLIRDFIIYPFDAHKETNKFGNFLKMIFKDYPAYFWIKPNIKKIIVFPFLVLYYIFIKKKKSPDQK